MGSRRNYVHLGLEPKLFIVLLQAVFGSIDPEEIDKGASEDPLGGLYGDFASAVEWMRKYRCGQDAKWWQVWGRAFSGTQDHACGHHGIYSGVGICIFLASWFPPNKKGLYHYDSDLHTFASILEVPRQIPEPVARITRKIIHAMLQCRAFRCPGDFMAPAAWLSRGPDDELHDLMREHLQYLLTVELFDMPEARESWFDIVQGSGYGLEEDPEQSNLSVETYPIHSLRVLLGMAREIEGRSPDPACIWDDLRDNTEDHDLFVRNVDWALARRKEKFG